MTAVATPLAGTRGAKLQARALALGEESVRARVRGSTEQAETLAGRASGAQTALGICLTAADSAQAVRQLREARDRARHLFAAAGPADPARYYYAGRAREMEELAAALAARHPTP